MLRCLSFGRIRLKDTYLNSIFRLMVLRIQVMVGARPLIAYQMEQIFTSYHEDLLKLHIRARFRLKPLKKLM